MQTALSLRRKMTKLRNSYPEGIACVLLFFSRLSNDGRISVLGRSEDCLCCQFLEWKLHVDLTVKQVHSGSTYFNCYTVLLVIRLAPSIWRRKIAYSYKLLSVLEDEDSFIDICRIISKLKCH